MVFFADNPFGSALCRPIWNGLEISLIGVILGWTLGGSCRCELVVAFSFGGGGGGGGSVAFFHAAVVVLGASLVAPCSEALLLSICCIAPVSRLRLALFLSPSPL